MTEYFVFVAQLTVKYVFVFVLLVFLSVPIIATAVQEELEIGSASSGDAACASNTVKKAQTVCSEMTCCISGNLKA